MQKFHRAFEQTIRERPRDASARLIYADWLEEQGVEEAARIQRLKAKQCTRFDPDFDYAASLKKLRVASKVRVTPIAFGEIVVLRNKSGERVERYCDAARLQDWLLEQTRIRRGRLSDPDAARQWFWEHVLGVGSSDEVEGEPFRVALQAAFEASKGPEYRESKNVIVRLVDKGHHVRRVGGKKPSWSLLTGLSLLNYVPEHGKEVFRHEHDYGGMTSGTHYVYRFNGEYWTDIDECGVFGPYRSLREALTDESCEAGCMVQLTGASSSICCSELSAEEVVKLLKTDYLMDCSKSDFWEERGLYLGEEELHDFAVLINDKVWQIDDSGRFKKAEGPNDHAAEDAP